MDNAIGKIFDPVQIGQGVSEELICTCKAVAKRDHSEAIGTIVKRNGQYDVAEF